VRNSNNLVNKHKTLHQRKNSWSIHALFAIFLQLSHFLMKFLKRHIPKVSKELIATSWKIESHILHIKISCNNKSVMFFMGKNIHRSGKSWRVSLGTVFWCVNLCRICLCSNSHKMMKYHKQSIKSMKIKKFAEKNALILERVNIC